MRIALIFTRLHLGRMALFLEKIMSVYNSSWWASTLCSFEASLRHLCFQVSEHNSWINDRATLRSTTVNSLLSVRLHMIRMRKRQLFTTTLISEQRE